MAGYSSKLDNPSNKESRWFGLNAGVHVFRILPISSSYFDPDAEPLRFYRYERKIIFNFPVRDKGEMSITIDKNSIVYRALRHYQFTLGKWEVQKEVMKSNGMDRFWARTRYAMNSLIKGQEDKCLWLDLPKSVAKDLHDKIIADPSIIDLDTGRWFQVQVTGEGMTKKYSPISVSNKPSAVNIKFAVSELDLLAPACLPTPIDWREIGHKTIMDHAKEVLKEDARLSKEQHEIEQLESTEELPAVSKASAPFSASEDDFEVAGDGFASAAVNGGAGIEEEDLAALDREIKASKSTEQDSKAEDPEEDDFPAPGSFADDDFSA